MREKKGKKKKEKFLLDQAIYAQDTRCPRNTFFVSILV